MTMTFVLLSINALIAFWMVYLIRRQDYYHPEPFHLMTLATVVGGILSVTIALGSAFLLQKIGLYREIGVVNFFLFTGPTEEAAKLIGFLFFIFVFRVKLDEPVDAIIYMSCVALGFSLIENFFYAIESPALIGLRSIISTPMHIVFSTVMALVFAVNNEKGKLVRALLKALLFASLLHALFDAVIYVGFGNFTFLFVVFAIFFGKRIFAYTLLNSPHRLELATALAQPTPVAAQPCLFCNTHSSHNSYVFADKKIEECQACENVILPEKQAERFLNHFLPHGTSFTNKNAELAEKLNGLSKVLQDKEFNTYRRFKIKEANALIETLAEEFRKVFERSATFSFLFSTRPLISPENGILNDGHQSVFENRALRLILIALMIFGGVCIVVGIILAFLMKLS